MPFPVRVTDVLQRAVETMRDADVGRLVALDSDALVGSLSTDDGTTVIEGRAVVLADTPPQTNRVESNSRPLLSARQLLWGQQS